MNINVGLFEWLSLLVILLFSFVMHIDANACPHYVNEAIQACVQPVAHYAKMLNQQENSSAHSSQSEFGQAISLPKLGGEVFKELCSLIRNFEMCVEEYKKTCPKHITINLIQASYGYLCNDGYSTFMKSAECLMDLDQKPEVRYCHDETLKDIEKANSEVGISMPVKLDRMCDALNFFSGCVRHSIMHNCGKEAWHVIFRVLKDTTKTLMPACQFTGQSTKAAYQPSTNRPRHHQTPSTTHTPYRSKGNSDRSSIDDLNTGSRSSSSIESPSYSIDSSENTRPPHRPAILTINKNNRSSEFVQQGSSADMKKSARLMPDVSISEVADSTTKLYGHNLFLLLFMSIVLFYRNVFS